MIFLIPVLGIERLDFLMENFAFSNRTDTTIFLEVVLSALYAGGALTFLIFVSLSCIVLATAVSHTPQVVAEFPIYLVGLQRVAAVPQRMPLASLMLTTFF